MHEHLFRHQDHLEDDDLVDYAVQLDLDVERFIADMDDEDLEARVQRDVLSAGESGARGTPTFFVGDCRHVGPYDAKTLIAELESGEPLG